MFKILKSKFWRYLLPRLNIKLNNYKNQQALFKKKKLESRLQSCGYNFNLNGNTHIIRSPEKVILGNNVHIGNNFYAASEGSLIIGDNCHISRNVTIYTVNHDYNGSVLPYDEKTNYKPVSIGKNVWIGMNVSILPGVIIGDGAIIGMGSIVNRNVEKNEIVGNDSLKSIKKRNENHYNNLEISKKYGGKNGRPLTDNEIYSYLPSYYENKNKKIVFVLGTGRSGSNSIVNILNQNPKCKALHEDIKQIIRISTELAYNPDNQTKYYKEIEKIFQNKIWQGLENQILIHSDQRLWSLIPFLKNYFPNSKFIHLKREPISCIKSMVARGWYKSNEYPDFNTHDWAKYRLRADRLNIMSELVWSSLTQVQKCTWYWFYINSKIENELKDLREEKRLELNLKNINHKLDILSNFINDGGFDYSPKITNQVRSNDLKKYKEINEKILSKEINSFLDKLKKNYSILF